MKQKQEITEQVAFSLVQLYAVVLFECNEAEDYGPAMTLMNTAFTFHHDGNYSSAKCNRPFISASAVIQETQQEMR